MKGEIMNKYKFIFDKTETYDVRKIYETKDLVYKNSIYQLCINTGYDWKYITLHDLYGWDKIMDVARKNGHKNPSVFEIFTTKTLPYVSAYITKANGNQKKISGSDNFLSQNFINCFF